MGVVSICNPGHPRMRTAMTPLPLHVAMLRDLGCHMGWCEHKYAAAPILPAVDC
jgi:hypothetical protein